jgi:hypothetical protein
MLNTKIQLETQLFQDRLNALLPPEVARIVDDLATLRMLNAVADYAPLPAAGLKMQAKLLRKVQSGIGQLEAATTTISAEPIPISVEIPTS